MAILTSIPRETTLGFLYNLPEVSWTVKVSSNILEAESVLGCGAAEGFLLNSSDEISVEDDSSEYFPSQGEYMEDSDEVDGL